jgi:hypothetical protein
MGNPWETHFLDFSNIIWHDNLHITRYHKHRLPILPSNLTPAVSPPDTITTWISISVRTQVHPGTTITAAKTNMFGWYGMVILWGVYF